jgi:GTPase SAR1 family protein
LCLFQVENQIATYTPDGYIVVFAVDDTESLSEAEQILCYLKSEDILGQQAVILVANKTDLVRSRVVSTNGKRTKNKLAFFKGLFIYFFVL